MPALRASVTVSGDVVRIGDLIDNAGTSAQIAIYRAPDLGTTGSLPTAKVLEALRAHQVIGVDTRDIKGSRSPGCRARSKAKDIEPGRPRAGNRSGLGDAANLTLTFDRDVQDIRLEASNSGAMQPVSTRSTSAPAASTSRSRSPMTMLRRRHRLRFTGRAIETVEAAVLTRDIERNDVLKASDVVVERRRERGSRSDPTTRVAPSECRRASKFAPARPCGLPISPSPIWCSATRASP